MEILVDACGPAVGIVGGHVLHDVCRALRPCQRTAFTGRSACILTIPPRSVELHPKSIVSPTPYCFSQSDVARCARRLRHLKAIRESGVVKRWRDDVVVIELMRMWDGLIVRAPWTRFGTLGGAIILIVGGTLWW